MSQIRKVGRGGEIQHFLSKNYASLKAGCKNFVGLKF